MGVNSFKGLLKHVGHRVVCVRYGHGSDTVNVAIECETCSEVLCDFDAPTCIECMEDDCPGVIQCPVCGEEEHGEEAFTMIQDHGRCWACHKQWQLGEADGEVNE